MQKKAAIIRMIKITESGAQLYVDVKPNANQTMETIVQNATVAKI